MAEPPSGTVTLLFSDIEGSTRLLQRTGGDAYAGLLAEHRHLLGEAFDRHHGFHVGDEGDSSFVVFPSADEAAEAAAEAQRALARNAWPTGTEVRVRIGLHTGEPRVIGQEYVGLDVHRAARVMDSGHGGQVLLTEATRALLDDRFDVRDLGDHRLRDLSGPQRLYQLLVDGLPTEFPPLRTLENRPTNLPAMPTSFVGRARELEEIGEVVIRDDVHLVTLTGPGGAGKSRLALQVASSMVESFEHGVFFVSLAPVRDWELVVPTIAHTIGLREQSGEGVIEALTEYLRDRQVLLVLDNLEQVTAVASVLARLLASAPGLKIIATSRTPLRVSGERTFAVRSLALEESVRLFAERAQAAAPEFELTDENRDDVAEICARLDGLPLAIELAAPRVRTLTPRALLRRLDQRLALLTGGAQDLDERQRTLRGAIEWSYDLLLAEEKTLFARLAVFVSGCRLEAAEAVCDPDGSSTRPCSTASTPWSRRAFCSPAKTRTASRASGCSRPSVSSRTRSWRRPRSPRRRAGGTRSGSPSSPNRSTRSHGRATSPHRSRACSTTTRTCGPRSAELASARTGSSCCASGPRCGRSGRPAATWRRDSGHSRMRSR
jgi:class 3 adenylate cyclase